MQKFELVSFANADDLARDVASEWLDEIAAADGAGKNHCVALSGGRIAQKFFAQTVEQAKERKISFARVHFFWADERCVPPDDAESNFKIASELLFSPLKITDAQIHRLRGEDLPEIAVQKATAEIFRFALPNSEGLPVLDLIFLGMGEDGHVASLFPNSLVATPEISAETVPYLSIKNSPKPPPLRLSMSYEIIAAAREVWVLASGSGKETALRESIFENGRTPLARVIQSRAPTKIFSDILLK